MKHVLVLPVLGIGLLALGCAGSAERAAWVTVRETTPMFLLSSAADDAAIAADAYGRVALTYVTRDSLGTDLWLTLSTDGGESFGAPQRVNLKPGRVSSFPEGRPMAAFGPAGQLVLVWCERRAGQPGAADVVIRPSGDGGNTLNPPVVVNDDAANGRPVYHGFPAVTFLSNGDVFAAWMDGRDDPAGVEEPSFSSLFYALSHDGGQSWADNVLLTDRLCPCCRSMAVADSFGGVFVAYRSAARDRRDPAIVVSTDGGASFGDEVIISADGWRLDACPSEGTAITANMYEGGYYAWVTGAEPAGAYLVPWRAEHGRSSVRRPLVDSLVDVRHPRLAALGSTTLIAVEGRPSLDTTRTVLAVRALAPGGALTPWVFLGADIHGGWLSATGSGSALACWTENADGERRVRVVKLTRARPRS